MKKLSSNLKKIRKENNLSQEELAEKLGVSRQSISKWENNEAYPEMDKMIKICELFNLNIDELLNQNINEVNSAKESKLNINKYIDDFLGFITKTIDMFTSMKFKYKIKCVFEQIILIGIISIMLLIIGAVLSNIYTSLNGLLPDVLFYGIFRILKSIYLLLSFILGIILILHIFKVRYLDYYIIVKEDDLDKVIEKDKKMDTKEQIKKEDKIIIDKPKEKIVIRDKKHSVYNFISGLLQIVIFIIKLIAGLFALAAIFSLIGLIILLVISFIFGNTHLLFIGTLLTLIGIIVINVIVLIIIYNFILSKKSKKNRLALVFLLSTILIGTGIGVFIVGMTKLDYVSLDNKNYYINKEMYIEMKKDFFIDDYMNRITYIESDNTDIKIEYIYHPLFDVKPIDRNNKLYFSHYLEEYKIGDILKIIIKDINNEKIVNYSQFEIKVYTTKENIELLKNNQQKYFEKINEEEIQNQINQYENRINDLESIIDEKEFEIERLNEELYVIKENFDME